MKRTLLLIVATLLSGITIDAQETSAFAGKSLFGSLRARHLGPASTSGRVSSLSVVESETEKIYVGAASGGLWKSISAGAYFNPVFDDYTQSIGKVAVDQLNPETIWVGTGEPWVRNSVSVGTGLYKSTNGGGSWKLMGLEDSERISDIIVHPENSDIVYVAAQGHLWDSNEERGVYKTSDGGETWERVFYIDENTGCADLEIDPTNPNVLYAAMWSHRRYPWSFDSGLNGESGLFKSVDAGKSWKPVHNGFPDETLGRIAVSVAPSNPNRVYATVEVKDKEKKGLYRSDDAGGSWELVSTSMNTSLRPFYFSLLRVDPLDENIVYKCGLNLIVSEDGGDSFRTVGSQVHSDIHDVWIDPSNTKHVIIGTDGGVYESYDRAKSFKMFNNLPLSQFYRISVDDAEPFNVYGGLQDNGSWFAPSQKAGGVGNADWTATFGGDGFYSFRHPVDEDIIYCEYQGGNLVRYNKKTGRAKDVKPVPDDSGEKYRFNWNSPIHLSSTNKERIYFGSQYLFRSEDRGESWQKISDDLTTDDPEKQKQKESGGLSIDNSTAENHCTIYSVAESPANQSVIWVGTDDGNIQVSNNSGSQWTNVTENLEGVPANTWVTCVEPSHHDANRAFVTLDGHRTGDKETYVYMTEDQGKTWSALQSENVDGFALCIREDLVNPDLLFLGTEFGLYVSFDRGTSWTRFKNNMPKVGVREMVIHPRDHSLVMGTHGRGAILIDDISPLREVKSDLLDQPLAFITTEPTILKDPGGGGGWFGGAGNYTASNPSRAAKIVYYMSKRHTFGKMFVEIYNQQDSLLKVLPAGKSAGINIVEMPTFLEKPKSAPTNNRMALFGSLFGPSLQAGDYKVKIVKGKESYDSVFTLENDPSSAHSNQDRALQRSTTMDLYNMSQDLAYIHHVIDNLESQALNVSNEELKDVLTAFAEKANKHKNSLVAMEGDFYVDEEERIRERISDLYRRVSSFPGRPSDTQISNTKALLEDMVKVKSDFESFIDTDLASINTTLTENELPEMAYGSFEAFLEDKVTGQTGGGGKHFQKYFVNHPMGSTWSNIWF